MTAQALSREAGGRSLRGWLLLAAAALAVLLGLSWLIGPNLAPAPLEQHDRALRRITATLDRNHPESVERLDIYLAGARRRSEQDRESWISQEEVGRLLLQRARLTGSYEDYDGARTAFLRAFNVAVPGSGPHPLFAQLNFAMHRLGAAEEQLNAIARYAVPPLPAERAEQIAMRGDIAFYRGDYQRALVAYDAADAIDPGVSTFRRAVYLSQTGEADAADRLFVRAAEQEMAPTAAFLAFIELQRGILDLDRGRLEDALRHFNSADAQFPGYWLIEEHIAETMMLRGDVAGAAARYEDIVRRTGHPEFMDALADLAGGRGDAAGEQAWRRRAGVAWRRRLALFPEASYGHAIDHCSARGDWVCALALAQRNHEARPYGRAKLVLAHALVHNGRAEEARALIDQVLASPWRTAELHMVAAEVLGAAGDGAAATRQRALALRLNPHSAQMYGDQS